MSNTIVAETTRKIKALELLAAGAVTHTSAGFAVQSQAGEDVYSVTITPPACTCQDARFRGTRCKHILAAALSEELSANVADFLARRDDLTAETFAEQVAAQVRDLDRADLTTDGREKRARLGAYLHILTHPTPPTPPTPTPAAQALAFSLRFWWPDYNPQSALDPVAMPATTPPAEIEIRDKSPEWRRTMATPEQIRALIDANEWRLGTPACAETRRRGRWEGLFVIPVEKVQ